MNYNLVTQTTASLGNQGWDVQLLVEADGYPIYALTDPQTAQGGSADRPALLIVAGVHGEEPGAVVGLDAWLRRHVENWVGRLRMYIIPCLNPWGFERGIRFGSHGRDLNREFGSSAHLVGQAFERWLTGKRFELFMDLHEDCDFEAMYLYEVQEDAPEGPSLGRRILDTARTRVELSDGVDVDGMLTRDGMISIVYPRDEARKSTGRPIALHVYAEAAPHVVTVETPGLLDIALRSELHVLALEVACRHLAGPEQPRRQILDEL